MIYRRPECTQIRTGVAISKPWCFAAGAHSFCKSLNRNDGVVGVCDAVLGLVWPCGCAVHGRFRPVFRRGRGGAWHNGRKESSLAWQERDKGGPQGGATPERTAKSQVESRHAFEPSSALSGGRCRCNFRRAHARKKRTRRGSEGSGRLVSRLVARRLSREEPGKHVARAEIV